MKPLKIVGIIIGAIILVVFISLLTSGRLSKLGALCKSHYEDYDTCFTKSIDECLTNESQKLYLVRYACQDIPSQLYDSQLTYIGLCGVAWAPDEGVYSSSRRCREIINCSRVVTCNHLFRFIVDIPVYIIP